ncbi:MAG TPA: hypothetical protein VND89_06395 [Acidimicrobiales bacterium]|nr:hypothetical protein [Acidimicrobiales bacterium]
MPKLTTHENGMPIWVDVMVETPEQHYELRAFLSALFDWTWDLGGPEIGSYSLALHDGAPVFGLGQGEGGQGVATTYFATRAIDDTVEQAVALGATIIMPATPVMELGSMAWLVDPVGATFGLWQPGTFQGFGAAYEPDAPGWFDHVSTSPERAGEFYADLTGHQLASPDPRTRILKNGEQWFASFSHSQTDEEPRWVPIFVVDSLKRIHEVVPRHGGAIVIDEMPVPGSFLCVFREPVYGTLMTVMSGGSDLT